MPLRDYQNEALELIRREFLKNNKKVLLVMPTGSGKTVVFCEMIKRLSENKKAYIVTRGRKLVDQASKRLFREDVFHGVLMANHWNFKPSSRIQVCSIDTLISRKIPVEDGDLVIVDEAHLFQKGTQGADLIEACKGFVVGVTATPYCKTGLKHLADSYVRPISMAKLIEQNSLVPFRIFAPSKPDLRGVRTQNGDFQNSELEKRMSTNQLTGKIIDHWIKIAKDRPTICFAVNVRHSKYLVENFLNNGIKAEHCDAETPEGERNAITKRWENGETKIISNVGIFCTGADFPFVSAIILARSTQSYNLYIQQTGRGTRTSPGKSECIILDHAGNFERHGDPTLEPDFDLDGKWNPVQHTLESKICKNCFAVYRGETCPECGEIPELKNNSKKDFHESNEMLIEVSEKIKNPIESFLNKLEIERKLNNRKNGWQFWKLVEKFGYEKSHTYLPAWFRRNYQLKNKIAKDENSCSNYETFVNEVSKQMFTRNGDK